jgi:putative methyltransferase (TIGR04325 family)
MIYKVKYFLKQLLMKIVPRSISFHGPYPSWKELIEKHSYHSPLLQNKLFEQAKRVWSGEAAYERDGFIFDEIQRSWPVSLTISKIINDKNKKSLSVLDFGGAYGSSYIENMFLESFYSDFKFNWNIVELPNIVKLGTEFFTSKHLNFYSDINEVEQNIDLVLFGSSIQYLEFPYEILSNVIKTHDPTYIIFDRTGVSSSPKDQIYLQKVKLDYKASYPAWILSEEKFLNFFKYNEYEKILDWNSIQIPDSFQKFKGFAFKK